MAVKSVSGASEAIHSSAVTGPDDFEILVERRRREDQHARRRGSRQTRLRWSNAPARMTGSPELIAPPDRRRRVARIEDVIERARPGRRDRPEAAIRRADRSASSASRAAAIGFRAPAPAMVEPPVAVAPSGAAAHHEDADGGFRVDSVRASLCGSSDRTSAGADAKKSSARLPSIVAAARNRRRRRSSTSGRRASTAPRSGSAGRARLASGRRSSRSRCARTGRTSPTNARPGPSA